MVQWECARRVTQRFMHRNHSLLGHTFPKAASPNNFNLFACSSLDTPGPGCPLLLPLPPGPANRWLWSCAAAGTASPTRPCILWAHRNSFLCCRQLNPQLPRHRRAPPGLCRARGGSGCSTCAQCRCSQWTLASVGWVLGVEETLGAVDVVSPGKTLGVGLPRTQLVPGATTTIKHLCSLWYPQHHCWST